MVEYCLHITVVPNECLTALFSHLFQNPSVLIFEVSAFHVSVRNKISKISDSFSVGIFFYLDLVLLIDTPVIPRVVGFTICSGGYSIQQIEGFYVEFNFHKNKWLVNCSYKPHIKVLLKIICGH